MLFWTIKISYQIRGETVINLPFHLMTKSYPFFTSFQIPLSLSQGRDLGGADTGTCPGAALSGGRHGGRRTCVGVWRSGAGTVEVVGYIYGVDERGQVGHCSDRDFKGVVPPNQPVMKPNINVLRSMSPVNLSRKWPQSYVAGLSDLFESVISFTVIATLINYHLKFHIF